ncbi:hypothetical protein J7F03_00375 [Streptomyces sp. ISL-43]|uniref:hypothetical protein n=1 Tax=Streptomyces sp. ISL-43 TaxID=2819183 RepID=UPI001BE7185F|nr:hypothetical protein [Streptomyces sp. ISL-43]MBT2445572.1 hypothetical protein [Streptomyces sp. ISL-43]
MSENRGRRLGTFGVVVCIAAAGLGGWFLYEWNGTRQDRANSRAEITEACEGLVDPERVMRLGRPADKVDAGERGDHLCVLRRAAMFEGQEEMYEYFSLTVAGSPGAVTGDGRFDYVGGRSVVVTAKCAEPVEGTGVTSFRVTATSEFERTDFADPGELAALAREAALRAAAKAGCATGLPEVPQDLTAAGR